MHLPTNVSKKMWPVLAASLIVFLVLGAAGWKKTLEQATGHAGLSEVLENTIEMVSGHDVIVVDHKFEEHWLLLVGKWGIKAVLAVALIQSGLMLFRRQIRHWRFRKVSGHQVFVGLGGYNADLALREAKDGRSISIVDEDEHHPRRGELEQAGALMVTGSCLDPQSLKAAGVERAARVVVCSPEGDDASIAAAESADSLAGRLIRGNQRQIVVCLESRQTRELLNQRWSLIVQPQASTTRIVSFEAAAHRQLVNRMARELSASVEVLNRGPRMLVVAEKDFAHEFIRAAIPFLQVSGEALPEYWVVVDDPKEKDAFDLLNPAASLVAKIHFVHRDAQLAPVCPQLAGLQFDMALVKLASESQTLQLSERLLRSSLFQLARVEAVVSESLKVRLVQDDCLRVSSIFELGLHSPEFGDLSLESKARENHEAYLAGLSQDERIKATGWNELPENLKESNRWAVLHREIKREIWSRTSAQDQPSMLEHLSICEHQRWMGEKAMDGWRHADLPEQDKHRRLHPSLIPWAALSETEKDKDRVQVAKALGLPDLRGA
jgi:Trk K+ transport system NAD-binding subunit